MSDSLCARCDGEIGEESALQIGEEDFLLSLHTTCLLELLKSTLGDVTRRYRDAEQDLTPPDPEPPELDEVVAAWTALMVERLGDDDAFLKKAKTGAPWGALQADVANQLPPTLPYRNGVRFVMFPNVMNAIFGQQGFGWFSEEGAVTRQVHAIGPDEG